MAAGFVGEGTTVGENFVEANAVGVRLRIEEEFILTPTKSSSTEGLPRPKVYLDRVFPDCVFPDRSSPIASTLSKGYSSSCMSADRSSSIDRTVWKERSRR